MKYLFSLALLLGLLACQNDARTTATEAPTPTTVANSDWTPLFDGANVDAWRSYNGTTFPTKGWRVENGELIVEHSGTEEAGFGGDIITKKKYKDFELELEYALSDTSNSGIFYLVQEVPGTPIWHNAPEFQLLDDATYKRTYPELTDKQLSGANYDMHAQTVDYSKPIGEWNTARIVKRGPAVTHYLNGQEVVSYELYDEDWNARYAASKFKDYPNYAKAETGHLGLQDHGHRVRFRNVRVREL